MTKQNPSSPVADGELLKLADALDAGAGARSDANAKLMIDAAEALRHAATRPQTEPAAWRWRYPDEEEWSVTGNIRSHVLMDDAIIEPLYAVPPASPPPVAGAEREQIARIIDPRAFVIPDSKRFDIKARQREALEKADEIAALSRSVEAGAVEDHKWLDPECGVKGCQSLAWKGRYESAVKGRAEFRQAYREERAAPPPSPDPVAVKALESLSVQCGNVIFNCEQRPADNARHLASWKGIKEFADAALARIRRKKK